MRAFHGLLGLMLVAACKPDLPERSSLVRSPRLLAVRAEPAEAAPGDHVTWTALLAAPADGDGDAAPAIVDWAFCATPKPPAENGAVASECQRGDGLRAIGEAGMSVSAALPDDACALFGPDAPAGYRAVDADVTGGYYQPVLAQAFGARAFFGSRIACNLANAPAAIASDYGKRYTRNANPRIASFDAPATIAPGDSAPLAVRWSAGDVESFVVFDSASQSLVSATESLAVAWYVSAGSVDEDITAASSDPLGASNVFHAPPDARAVTLYAVVRDSRGGVDFRSRTITVAR